MMNDDDVHNHIALWNEHDSISWFSTFLWSHSHKIVNHTRRQLILFFSCAKHNIIRSIYSQWLMVQLCIIISHVSGSSLLNRWSLNRRRGNMLWCHGHWGKEGFKHECICPRCEAWRLMRWRGETSQVLELVLWKQKYQLSMFATQAKVTFNSQNIWHKYISTFISLRVEFRFYRQYT